MSPVACPDLQYFSTLSHERHDFWEKKVIYNQPNNMVSEIIPQQKKTSFKLINGILLALSNKLIDGGIFGDFEKTLSYIHHDILLLKCEFYGFKGKINALLGSYISDRYQRVVINNSSSNNTNFSEWDKIKHDVSQGSTLGALFFLLCINDLPNKIIADPSKPILFADDTSIVITNPRPSKFKEDINNIIDDKNDWFRSNSLSFIQFRPKNRYYTNLKVTCDNKLIKGTKNTKFFGLDIDSSLSWKNHIKQMNFKLGRACYATPPHNTLRYMSSCCTFISTQLNRRTHRKFRGS
jgi:hypothetical protein